LFALPYLSTERFKGTTETENKTLIIKIDPNDSIDSLTSKKKKRRKKDQFDAIIIPWC